MSDNDAPPPRGARGSSGRSPTDREAWSETLEDMERMAADRRSSGWSVCTVTAAHTDVVSRDMREDDRFGLMHVMPNNHAERFETAWANGTYDEYLLYTNGIDRNVYAVIELLDPDDQLSIFLACQYDLTMASGMVRCAEEADCLYSHLKTIDGSIIASIPFEEYDGLVSLPGASSA